LSFDKNGIFKKKKLLQVRMCEINPAAGDKGNHPLHAIK